MLYLTLTMQRCTNFNHSLSAHACGKVTVVANVMRKSLTIIIIFIFSKNLPIFTQKQLLTRPPMFAWKPKHGRPK